MSIPTPEEFLAAVRSALSEVGVPEEQLAILDEKGLSLDLENEVFVDSTDLLDVVFFIDKELDVKIGLEKFLLDDRPKTLQNLYDTICDNVETPA